MAINYLERVVYCSQMAVKKAFKSLQRARARGEFSKFKGAGAFAHTNRACFQRIEFYLTVVGVRPLESPRRASLERERLARKKKRETKKRECE